MWALIALPVVCVILLPISSAAGVRILLRSRPEASLGEASKALSEVLEAVSPRKGFRRSWIGVVLARSRKAPR